MERDRISYYRTNAFITDSVYTGNPASICLLDDELDETKMQKIAKELNSSETGFIHQLDSADYKIQWYSPDSEVHLCGHVMLAAAHTLREIGLTGKLDNINFHTTHSGKLNSSYVDSELTKITLPADLSRKATPPMDIPEALGVSDKQFYRSKYDWVIELSDPDEVSSLDPDMEKLHSVSKESQEKGEYTRGFFVTSRDCDRIVSRVLMPIIRNYEDGFNGSAHCVLASYWGDKFKGKSMDARQISPRGGRAKIKLDGNKVELTGKSAIVFEGLLNI